MASHGGKGHIPMFRACVFLPEPISHCDSFHVITPSLDQLSNDTNIARVDVMCRGYETSELSEVSFVFVH